MESITALTTATAAALARDYYLWIGLFVMILAFGVYVYFVPGSLEFFETQRKQEPRVRSEPPAQTANTQEVEVAPAPAPESDDLNLDLE